MRSAYFSLTLAVIFLVGCTTTPGTPLTLVPTNTSVPVPTSTLLPQRAPLLRIAVFGEVSTTNVWALFEESGADYWNYATQSSYWPRLYHLAPPTLDLVPATARGMPSQVVCDSDACIATVTLHPDLHWTDGSPFTADDVAFTANTAMQFRLGLNWNQAYNPDVLKQVKALDSTTVKFIFYRSPTVADWYFGVLQGPIVNQAYWGPRIANAVKLLPEDSLLPTIIELEQELANLQARVDELNLSLNTMAPASVIYQDTAKQAKRFQEELNSISNKIDKNRTVYETKLSEARAALLGLANANEPILGPWRFASRISGHFENQANLGTPFGDPWFDRVQYITYPDELAAAKALQKDEVDVILFPEGLSEDTVSRLENDSAITLSHNMTRSARFLAFNHANPYLAEPALHQALACMLDSETLGETLGEKPVPLSGFVLSGLWRANDVALPCAGETEVRRLERAIEILKKAGYSWRIEPSADSVGGGFRNPGGSTFPRFTLLTPEGDPLRVETAEYIAQQAEIMGMSVEVRQSSPDDLLYDVYGSRGYDMALLGWRLSIYPEYLCEWFEPEKQNPFAYNGSKLRTECDALNEKSELDDAQTHVYDIQSILAQDLPLIPLYVESRTDAYRNVHYPFENLLDGLSGLYGAPTLAIPNP